MSQTQIIMRLDTLEHLPPLEPPAEIGLRHFMEGDEAHWNTIIEMSFRSWSPTFDPFMKDDPSFKPERVCFATLGGVPVATASAFRRPEYGEDVGYIHMVGANYVYSGKRLGYWATLAALWRIREDGCASAVLSTDDFRIPAIKTYLKLGFRPELGDPAMEARWDAVMRVLSSASEKGKPMKLWPGDVPGFDEALGQERPALTPFLAGEGARGAMIVCPGGGYGRKAGHEGEPIARMLNRHGIHAFVLDYRVAPYRHPYPLQDAQRALRYLRYNANTLGIKPGKIGVMGFSAGGHLAAMAGVHWDAGDPGACDPIDRVSCRPDCFAPCYAVVSFAAFTHNGSVDNLLGERERTNAMLKWLSGEYCVTEDTPPCFLWHTANDEAVPVENSLRLAAALGDKGVKYALHIFPEGKHGLGLAEDVPYTANWPRLLGEWLLGMGWGQDKADIPIK